MGLFDYFSRESGQKRRKESARKRVTEMYYKTEERTAALYDMSQLAREEQDVEAVAVMLRRFDFIAPNHTVDLSEKELAHDLIVGLGTFGIEPTQAFCRKTTQPIFWQLKILHQLLEDDAFGAWLAELLQSLDTDYHRDPQKKLSIVQWSGELASNPAVIHVTLPFVEDHHEDVRYVAVDAVLKSARSDSRLMLLQRLAGEEESRRVLTRLASGFAELGWTISERLDEVRAHLPVEFLVTPDARLKSR
jgi:hypothetical protein